MTAALRDGRSWGVEASLWISAEGQIVYPRTLFIDGQPPADLSTAPTPQPQIIGDTLWSRTSNAHPVCLAMSTDGSTWNRYHPQRLVASITGAGRPPVADYPTQLLVGMAGGKAKITHIANLGRGWVPVEEPPPGGGGKTKQGVFGDESKL